MSVLPLVIYPDPRLKIKSKPVEKVDKKLQDFMDDMLETMYDSEGIGLAAVQVGVHKRILVMDISKGSKRYENLPEEASGPLYLVNPEIVWKSEELSCFQEGCLSLPEQYSDVYRPAEVKVKYLDYHGKEQVMHCSGILATCVQHEMDHLDGIVFIEHISPVKRDMIDRKLRKKQRLSQ